MVTVEIILLSMGNLFKKPAEATHPLILVQNSKKMNIRTFVLYAKILSHPSNTWSPQPHYRVNVLPPEIE